MRPPGRALLLEREDALARVDRVVDGAVAGHGGAVVVEGPAGIGKTAVLQAARTAAEARAIRVLRARGALLEREHAFGVVGQLLEPTLAALPDAARADVLAGPAGLAAGALGLAGSDAPPADGAPPPASFTVLHGLYWLCANLAARGPLVVAVDDLQWADVPSVRFLLFLLARVEELPVAITATVRTGERGPAAEMVATVATDPAATAVRLAPLSRDAVAALLERRLGAAPDPAFAAACHELTRGTPFFVGELVTGLADQGIAPTGAEVGRLDGLSAGAIGRWMLVRLDRLGPDALALARALAVLESADPAEAAALADLEPAAAAAATDALVTAGIVDDARPLAFTHPIVRAAIFGELAAGDRDRAHRRAAELLAGGDGSLDRVAEHLLATEPTGDADVAERLAAAADAALHRGAPEPAIVLLRRALAEPPAPRRRARLLLDLGFAEESVGDGAWREHLEAALAAAGDDEERVEIGLYLSYAYGRSQEIVQAVSAADRTLAALEGGDASDLGRQALEATAVGIALLDPRTAGPMRPRMERLRRAAAAGGPMPKDVPAVAAYIAALAGAPTTEFTPLALAALAEGPGALPARTESPWFSFASIVLTYAGEHALVQQLFDHAVGQAQATGNGAVYCAAISFRALVALRRGDLLACEADARAGLTSTDLPLPDLYRAICTGNLVTALAWQGRLDEAEAELRRVTDLVDQRVIGVTEVLAGRAHLRVAQGRPDAAIADLERMGEIFEAVGNACRGQQPWGVWLARARLAAGDAHGARELAEAEVVACRRFGAPRELGLALHAAGAATGGDAGLALLQEAVGVLARADAAVAHADALVELGAALRRANRRSEARDPLTEGLALAQAARAAQIAERAEVELGATGARPRRAVLTGVEALTASERRVAGLAAEGATNREIAQALFVTARTVEGHLTQVFRKLELSSRDELPGVLAAG
jgi:DNA-binding CsgD family transcriptional regulator